MDIARHLEKAQRMERSLAKLKAEKDYAALVEGYMHLTTHLVNAILHARGIKEPDRDLIHTDMGTPAKAVDEETAKALTALRKIEDLRPFYVRGGEPYRAEVDKTCAEAAALIKTVATKATGARV